MLQPTKKVKERPEHYVNGREFFEAMKVYHEAYLESVRLGEDKPQVSTTIARAIVQINTRLANLYNFAGYTYRDEMISDGILKCLDKVHRFDPSVSEQAFAWFTQCAWNEFIARIKKEQHQTSVKARMIRDKMSDEFVQHGVDAAGDDTSNSFVDFLRDVDCFTDYHEERAKKAVHPSMNHKNKTAYKKKEVELKEVLPFHDLTSFE